MKYSPHDYQEYAISFLMENPVAAIFLDMGMGKNEYCADGNHEADV